MRPVSTEPTVMNSHRREGVALPMVLGAMVLIGVLIAGVLFSSLQEFRTGGNAQHSTRAAAAAEMGLNRVLVEWNTADNNRLKTGDTLRRSFLLTNGGRADVMVTRLPGPFLWAVSEGQAGPSRVDLSARRQFGSLLRFDIPEIGYLGALTARGGVKVGGSAYVSGTDYTISGSTGCPVPKAVAGVALPDTSTALKMPGCSITKSCISGTPAWVQTTAANDTSTYFTYGSTNYWKLAAMANKIIPAGTVIPSVGPVVVSGVCQKSLPYNWGELQRLSPSNACESFFPIIHALGNLQITGGSGQGIMLVDGDLTLSGSFWFSGMVIVRGTLSTSGSGAGILGAVLAANVDLDLTATSTLGNSYVQYSSCSIMQALVNTSPPKQAKDRGWVEVF
jgi:hypothetical protein